MTVYNIYIYTYMQKEWEREWERERESDEVQCDTQSAKEISVVATVMGVISHVHHNWKPTITLIGNMKEGIRISDNYISFADVKKWIASADVDSFQHTKKIFSSVVTIWRNDFVAENLHCPTALSVFIVVSDEMKRRGDIFSDAPHCNQFTRLLILSVNLFVEDSANSRSLFAIP